MKGRIDEVDDVASEPPVANESTASEFTPTKNAWEEEDKGKRMRRIEEVDDVASVTTTKSKWVDEDACSVKLIGETQVLSS